MQYHYVVAYDSEYDRWFVESDPYAFFPGGNIFSLEEAERAHGDGWIFPDENSDEERIDYECYRVLESCIPGILPTPSKEV